jgi:hypothetical protein
MTHPINVPHFLPRISHAGPLSGREQIAPTVYIAEMYPIFEPFFSTLNCSRKESNAGSDPKMDPSYPAHHDMSK